MFPARLAIAKATEDAQPAAGGTCQTFNATLKLFAPAALGSSQVTLEEITAQSFEITHVGTDKISEDQEVIVGQTIDERWITLPSPTNAHPRIQFLTLAKISMREVYVKVLRTHHNAPNPATGLPLKYGDTLTICDPFNLWSDIEAGATGWAYLVYFSEDDPSTTGVTEPSHHARYEIEECSLPINELEGTIEECLFPGTEDIEVRVAVDVGIRSSYPNVDWPPEVDDGTTDGGSSPGTAYKFIPAENNLHLDAVKGSKVIIRRITNLMSSDPDPNYTCPKSRSTTEVEWEIVHVEKWWARIIKVKRTAPNTDWFYADEYGDGEWPGEDCDYSIWSDADTAEDICGNAEEGTIDYGWAIWKTKLDEIEAKYQVLSSKSALLGDPEKINIVQAVAFDGCDLNSIYSTAKVFCKSEPQLSSTSLNPVPKTVLTAGHFGLNSECGFCQWRLEQTERTIILIWSVINQQWEVAPGQDACSELPGLDPLPNPPADVGEEGQTSTVQCLDNQWVQISHCTVGGTNSCSCTENPPAITGEETPGDLYPTSPHLCESSEGTGSLQLCFTYNTETIYTLPCPGGANPQGPISGGCIPLTDCPEGETP